MRFKLALIQMLIKGGNKTENLSHAEELIDEAAGNGADLVLLPEVLDIGWTHPLCKTEAESIPDGQPCRKLAEIASSHSIYICCGLTEREGDKVFNSAVIIHKNGDVISIHRKIKELIIAHEYYDQGDRLSVVHTELGTLGLMICADASAKGLVLSRSLGFMGADIILSPAAWAVDADHDNSKEPYGEQWKNSYKPVVSEFSIWIAGVSNVGYIDAGPWSGRKCIGCSLVIGPDGKEVLQGPYGVNAEKVLYVDIETVKRPARGAGWHKYWKENQDEQDTA